MNTRPSRSRARVSMAWSVKPSQPLPWWAPALPCSTDSTALSSSTPRRAQGSRQPWSGRGSPSSVPISLKMFSSDGGTGTPGSTEKHRPWAWPGPWYGSWPRITTLTWSKGVASNAANRRGPGGYTCTPAALRWRRNADSSRISGRSSQSPMRAFQDGSRRMTGSSAMPGSIAPATVRGLALLQPRQAQLEQHLGDQQAFLDGLLHQVVGAGAQQPGLVVAVGVAGHHQHRQAALAVVEVDADPLDHVAPAQLALEGHVGEHQVDARDAAQRLGGQQGERLLGGGHVHDFQLLSLERALGGLGHDAAVLDVQHARAGDRLRLHVAADELGQRLVPQRLVEVVGDVFGEAALDQVLLGVAGDHDDRHVGLGGGAHAARQLHAVAVRQRQRRGHEVDRTGL